MKNIHMGLTGLSLAAFIGSFFATSCGQEDRMIRVGQRIHHDDFEYSVTSFRVAKTLGEGKETVVAAGRFYVVVFQVENHAKRVNHEWVDSIAYIVDEKNNVYEPLPSGLKEEHLTPPGGSDSTVLVFDLPEEVHVPCLMVRGETLMGDVFDGGQFRRVKIGLW